MSLWLQSLEMCLNGVQGDGDEHQRRRAGIILAYFSMWVPGRMVYELRDEWRTRQDIALDDAFISPWHDALRLVRAAPELRDFTMAQLLALALRGRLGLNNERGSLDDWRANHALADYVIAADRQLEEAPELRSIAEKLFSNG